MPVALLENGQGRCIVRLVGNFADQLAVQHFVVFVENHDRTGGQAGQWAVGDGNAVVDGCDLPPGFYVPSTTRIGPKTDLSQIPRVTANATEFSEDVAHTNIDLVKGYKSLANEF